MEKRSPQLDAAVPRLESAWAQLIPALPVWRDEAVPANERAGTRALLEQWRLVATLAARAAIPLACAAQTIFGPDGICRSRHPDRHGGDDATHLLGFTRRLGPAECALGTV